MAERGSDGLASKWAGVEAESWDVVFSATSRVIPPAHLRVWPILRGVLRSGTGLHGLLIAGIILTLCSGCAVRQSRDEPPAPIREFRAAWVATVANIDWPSKPTLSADERRAEMNAILDRARSLNLNAVLLQVRPACDAMYASDLEPWSEYLTGTQGVAPESPEDPLREWIEGAHARGIQLHAWFNPFRARMPDRPTAAAETHVSVRRSEFVRSFGGMLWLDPGEVAAREHSLRVVMDVVRRYEVDGVHFDDYFYPYPVKDQPFPDDVPFSRYAASGGTLDRSEWRRANVDDFVRRVYTDVKREKPWICVSISPFGIWRPGFPGGVAGFDAYEGLSADARRWLREGWVDMLVPQLYWRISAPKQRYPDLMAWWAAQNTLGRTLVIGNSASRIGDAGSGGKDDARAYPVHEIVNQIILARAHPGVSGNILFSMKPLMANRQGIFEALREGVYAQEALVPEMGWSATGALPARPALTVESRERSVALTARSASSLPPAAWLVQTESGGVWSQRVEHGAELRLELEGLNASGSIRTVAVRAIDRYGRTGPVACAAITPEVRPRPDTSPSGP